MDNLNRVIKFRIFNKKANEWIHGPNEVPALDGVNLFGEYVVMGGLLRGVPIKDYKECVALQYTGEKESNGREIFQGDILLCPNRFINKYVVVKFVDGFFDFDGMGHTLFFKYNVATVAGNIFDTPELARK